MICSSTPLTLSTGGATVDATVWIEAGTQANITLDGVDIASHVPFTIERNRDAAGNSVDPKTSVHITLAAGSANRLRPPRRPMPQVSAAARTRSSSSTTT